LGHGFYVASWRQRAACCHCLWVIWVIVFLVTQMTQKLAPACATGLSLWVIWVILSRDKNRCGKARARAVPNLLGYTLISKSFIFLIRINDPNDLKHAANEYLRRFALGSIGAPAWPNDDLKNPKPQCNKGYCK
jgi:hypothetical protein